MIPPDEASNDSPLQERRLASRLAGVTANGSGWRSSRCRACCTRWT